MSSAASTTSGIPGQQGALRDDLDALKADVNALKEDLRRFGRDATSAARSGAGEVGGRMSDMADRLRRSSRHAYEAARDKTKEATEQVEHQIEEHPFAAVGIAFGAGLLIGALVSRRKPRSPWEDPLFQRLSELAVRIADLAEAEGRELRRVVTRMGVSFTLGLVAALLVLAGGLLLLAALWFALRAIPLSEGWSSFLTALAALVMAGGLLYAAWRVGK